MKRHSQSVSLSVRQPDKKLVGPSVGRSVSPSVVSQFVCVSVSQSVISSVYPSVSQSVSQFVRVSVRPSVRQSVSPPDLVQSGLVAQSVEKRLIKSRGRGFDSQRGQRLFLCLVRSSISLLGLTLRRKFMGSF